MTLASLALPETPALSVCPQCQGPIFYYAGHLQQARVLRDRRRIILLCHLYENLVSEVPSERALSVENTVFECLKSLLNLTILFPLASSRALSSIPVAASS